MDFLSAAGKPPSATFCISWPCENMTRWITGAGSFPSLGLAAGTGDTHCYSTSGTAFQHFMPFSTVLGVFLNVPGVPCIFMEKDTVLLWKLTETMEDLNHAVNLSSFNIQHEQNLGGIEFKILKLKKKKKGC